MSPSARKGYTPLPNEVAVERELAPLQSSSVAPLEQEATVRIPTVVLVFI
jgi:hypothetical protein